MYERRKTVIQISWKETRKWMYSRWNQDLYI